MIELPPVNDKSYAAIRQRTTRAALAIRTQHLDTPPSYASLALVQAGVSELVRIYGAESAAGFLAELASELDSTAC